MVTGKKSRKAKGIRSHYEIPAVERVFVSAGKVVPQVHSICKFIGSADLNAVILSALNPIVSDNNAEKWACKIKKRTRPDNSNQIRVYKVKGRLSLCCETTACGQPLSPAYQAADAGLSMPE